MMDEEQRLIVEMIANGRLTAEEGAALLAALEGDERPFGGEASPGDDAPPAGASVSPPPLEGFPTSPEGRVLPDFARFRRLWVWPFAIMAFFTLLTGGWLALLLFAHSGAFWLTCAWLMVALSLTGLLLAWMSRSARWLYLRVMPEGEDWPHKLVFIFPLPLGLLSWVLGLVPHWIDKLPISANDWRELGRQIKQHLTPETPLYIQVDDGDQVEIFIG